MAATESHRLNEKLLTAQGCPLFTKCCFFVQLRTWCFIFGYLSLVFNILMALFYAANVTQAATLTHGFHYLHIKQTQAGDVVLDDNPMDRTRLRSIVIMAFLAGILNFVCILLNSFLLFGLHKKRPSFIKLHVIIAFIRLLLSAFSLITVDFSRAVFYWIEIGASAYFIMLYYTYGKQLEREQKGLLYQQDSTTDLVVGYSEKIENNLRCKIFSQK